MKIMVLQTLLKHLDFIITSRMNWRQLEWGYGIDFQLKARYSILPYFTGSNEVSDSKIGFVAQDSIVNCFLVSSFHCSPIKSTHIELS